MYEYAFSDILLTHDLSYLNAMPELVFIIEKRSAISSCQLFKMVYLLVLISILFDYLQLGEEKVSINLVLTSLKDLSNINKIISA